MHYTDPQKLEIARILTNQFLNQVARLGVDVTLTPGAPYAIDLEITPITVDVPIGKPVV